jgi:adenine-specific DNA methylase
MGDWNATPTQVQKILSKRGLAMEMAPGENPTTREEAEGDALISL